MKIKLLLSGLLGLVLGVASAESRPDLREWACADGDSKAVPVARTPPDYPHSAALLCLEGSVVVRYTIGQDGSVSDVQVAESQPPGLFDRAAIHAAESWMFRPACEAGQIVSTEHHTALDFVMEPAAAKDCEENPPELDDAAMDLLAETGAMYGLFAEARLRETEHDEVRFMLEEMPVPELEAPYLAVWRFHRDALIQSLDAHRNSRQALLDSGFPFLLFKTATYENDPDMIRTRAALDDIGDALDQYIESLKRRRLDLEADYAVLERTTELDEDKLELLVLSFLGDFRQGAMQEQYDLWRVQYGMMDAAVELLENNAGYWRLEDDLPRFDDAEMDTGFRRILFQLSQSIQHNRQQSRAQFRSFGDYINTE